MFSGVLAFSCGRVLDFGKIIDSSFELSMSPIPLNYYILVLRQLIGCSDVAVVGPFGEGNHLPTSSMKPCVVQCIVVRTSRFFAIVAAGLHRLS